MNITISTNKKDFFRQSLQIIRDIPPLDKLSKRELDVLAMLLYYDYMYKDIKEILREKLVFDYESRVAMQDSIGISEATFNNILTSLRKKHIILGKKIVNRFSLNPDTPIILFKFNIEDDNQG